MNAWWTLGETWGCSEERDKSSVNANFFFLTFQLPCITFSYNVQPKVAVHSSRGGKK